MMKNYYQILEIELNASQDDIKTQYRFLVQAWHPDKFPNPAQKRKAEEKLKEINAAYEILRDPAKRAEYDSRVRYANSNYQQEYREQSSQRKSEDERRRKEEAARRAEEEQRQKEAENKKRAEEEKRRAEEMRRQRIIHLDREISLIKKETKMLRKELIKTSNPTLLSILLLVGGSMVFLIGLSVNVSSYNYLGGILFLIGIIIIAYNLRKLRVKFDSFGKREQHLKRLIWERKNLKNT
jgi:curved DNA-binding protein CbpA